MLITAFAFAEFSTGMLWGRVSDRIGRKPVLIMGLIGTAFSMICFGFSKSLTSAILARALGGLLNGNVGVLQTAVAELVTKKEHQPRAYSIMPFVWCLGSIIGPAMGGALAMPCEAYPWLFLRGSLFDRYPFLLPNLVCVIVLLFGITNGILFLEETHIEKRNRRDVGLQAGRYLSRKIFGEAALPNDKSRLFSSEEEETFDPPPGYQSTEGTPRIPSTTPFIESELESCTEEANYGMKKTFNRQVILVIVAYGILAYHSVSFDSLMPVFLSEPRSQTISSLPFRFSGGFGLSTNKIGFMMAVQGVYSMIAQLWFFPFIVRRVGTLSAFRTVMVVWPLLYFAVPYLVLLPSHFQIAGAYLCLLTKITFHVIAFPSNAILLANAAPSKSVLGTINGVAASTACLARAFGPTVSGAIHSFGLSFGCNGLAWWAGGLVCAIGAFESFFMEEAENRHVQSPEADDGISKPLLLCHTVDATEETFAMRNSLESVPALDLSAVKA